MLVESMIERAGSVALNAVNAGRKALDSPPSSERTATERLEPVGFAQWICYLNLLSLVGEGRSAGALHKLALESMRARLRSERKYFSALLQFCRSGLSSFPFLEGLNDAPVRELLRRGKGLILCSYHFGPYRFLPTSLASAGFEVLCCLDEKTFCQAEPLQRRLDQEQKTFGAGRVELLNVEQHDAAFRLIRALRRNEVVLIFVDGNNGWDGPSGTQSRSRVRFGSFTIKVKNGAARLALMTAAPILPLIARENGNVGCVRTGEPIFPNGEGTPPSDFVASCMQSLYRFVERNVTEAPQHWEKCRYLHTWREPPDLPQVAVSQSCLLRVEESLLRGTRFRLNQRRIIPLVPAAANAWVDVMTLKVYRQRSGMDLFGTLAAPRGLDRNWVAKHCDPNAKRSLFFMLAALLQSGSLVSVETRANPDGRRKKR